MAWTPLRHWLNQITVRDGIKQLARLMGRSPKTVEDWVYGRHTPKSENKILLFLITGLDDYAPTVSEKPIFKKTKDEFEDKIKKEIAELARALGEVEHQLNLFSIAPDWGRTSLRKALPPQYIAYLAGYLRAILAEDRLDNWRVASEVAKSISRKGGGTL